MRRPIPECSLLVLLLCGGDLCAQSRAPVNGRVVDETGAAIPGAAVMLAPRSGGNPREAATDRTGGFAFDNVSGGEYSIHVELSGFQPVNVPLSVTAETPPPLTIRLKVGFEEDVTVTAEQSGGVLSPGRNADAVEFDPEALRGLPTETQGLLSLIENFTAPGAGGSGLSVVLDGAETDGLDVPASAIHRLHINRNPYSAEFKGPGKAQVEIETERGSRRFYHGSGALFVRNSALDWRNAFAATTPDLDRRLGEGSVGGPLFSKGWAAFVSGQYLSDH